MKALVKLIMAAVVVVGLATPARAALVAGVIPEGPVGTNQFIPDLTLGPTIGGYYGAQLYLVGGTVDITAEWYGGEAGYNNQFKWGSDTPFSHPGGDTTGNTVDGTYVANAVSPGLLPFSFFTPQTGLTVANGANPDNSGTGPNFFVTFYDLTPGIANTAPGGPGGGQFVWIFFDDGGAANDDNHDDMAIKLTITGDGHFEAVPEPGSMILLGSGLAALLARRRRS